MSVYKSIEVEMNKMVATVWLNRPDVHNAFNGQMMNEITECFEKLENSKDIRAILIRGKGKSFCSGADLQWMIQSENENYQENLKGSLEMANCFRTIYDASKPTIALVHGTVFGGANGLTCACDFVIAETNTRFSFPELKIGLVPSTILPYVLTRVNQHTAKLLMYTGGIISGSAAHELGLVDYLIDEPDLDKNLKLILHDLLKASANAIAECKTLINGFSNKSLEKEIESSVESITRIKMSEDAREGISAFLEKRKPNWVNDHT